MNASAACEESKQTNESRYAKYKLAYPAFDKYIGVSFGQIKAPFLKEWIAAQTVARKIELLKHLILFLVSLAKETSIKIANLDKIKQEEAQAILTKFKIFSSTLLDAQKFLIKELPQSLKQSLEKEINKIKEQLPLAVYRLPEAYIARFENKKILTSLIFLQLDDLASKIAVIRPDQEIFAIYLENILNLLQDSENFLNGALIPADLKPPLSKKINSTREKINFKFQLYGFIKKYKPSKENCGAAITETKSAKKRASDEFELTCLITGFKQVWWISNMTLERFEKNFPQLRSLFKELNIESVTWHSDIKTGQVPALGRLIVYTKQGKLNAFLLKRYFEQLPKNARIYNEYLVGTLLGYDNKDIEHYYVKNKKTALYELDKKEADEWISKYKSEVEANTPKT